MAGTTLAQAQTNLDNAQAAYTTALKRKAYGIGTRTLTAHDIDKLRKEVEYWSAKVSELTRGAGIRTRGITLG